jgi:hypothetical protein
VTAGWLIAAAGGGSSGFGGGSDSVERAAAELFREVTAAWTALDTERLSALVGPHPLKEWRRRLRDVVVDRDGRTLPPARWMLALDGDGGTPWRTVAVQ